MTSPGGTVAVAVALLLCGCGDPQAASPGGDGGSSDAGGFGGAAAAGGSGGVGDAGGGEGGTTPADACRFEETFAAFTPESWGNGTFGAWTAVYIDTVGVETDGSNVHFQRPLASTDEAETHANLVVTSAGFDGDLDVSVRLKTVEQLRKGSPPNNWEVAWIFWNYLRPEQSYYFAPKPVGWELGKSDDTKADPNGPDCDWPAYSNCLYQGAQRYLATGSSPSFAVGEWHTVRIAQSGGTISIWVNGDEITTVTDTVNVLQAGKLGLYNEDAHVRFDDICVK